LRRKLADPIVGLTAVLVLLTGVMALVAYLQWRTLEKTDDTTWATNRPWLQITSKLSGPVVVTSFDGSTPIINIPVTFSLKNFGKIPASDIRLFGGITTPQPRTEGGMFDGLGCAIPYKKEPPIFDLDGVQVCNQGDALFTIGSVLGQTAFPEQTVEFSFSFTDQLPPDKDKYFLIVGCALYRTGKKTGRTAFRLEVGTRSGGFRLQTPAKPITHETKLWGTNEKIGEFPTDKVTLAPTCLGNFAD